jgi:hypothetical protein
MTSMHHPVTSDQVMPSSRKRRLPLVPEADATGRTLEIYQEIKSAIGIPHVNVIFQAYGAHPRFLAVMWNLLRPAVTTREFFAKADHLGAEAYTWMHNYFTVPDLCNQIKQVDFSVGAQHELTGVVELLHYNNPLLLLIAAILLQAFEDGPVKTWRAEVGADHPVFKDKPIKITEEAAPAPIRKIYDDIKRTLGVSYVNTDYQVFARWQDFLSAYWNALKAALTSPMFSESKHSLRESALFLASQLPNAPQLGIEHAHEMNLSSEEMSAAIHITEEFLETLSGLVLNIAFARIALEGGNQSRPTVRPEGAQKQAPTIDQPGQAA